MAEFLENTLNITRDGTLNVSEAVLMAIMAVVGILVLILIKNAFDSMIKKYGPGRQKTIFSHRKNQYKTKISKGKKNKY